MNQKFAHVKHNQKQECVQTLDIMFPGHNIMFQFRIFSTWAAQDIIYNIAI